MLMMAKEVNIIIKPIIAQVIRALAEASFCLSPPDVIQLIPPQIMIRTLMMMPVMRNMFIPLLRIFPTIFVPG